MSPSPLSRSATHQMSNAMPPPLPALTAQQMAEVDRVLVEELGLQTVQVMELAGYAVASFARARFLAGDPSGRRVLVLAGAGGNGGDGLVAARYLHAWGAEIEIVLSRSADALRGAAAANLTPVERLGLPIVAPGDDRAIRALPAADLIVDGLLGFGLTGPPRASAAALIRAANDHPAPTLAIDLPSGLDATSGQLYDPCVRATATLTLALPKTGLLVAQAADAIGELHVADIGVPREVYARLGLTVDALFGQQPIVRLR